MTVFQFLEQYSMKGVKFLLVIMQISPARKELEYHIMAIFLETVLKTLYEDLNKSETFETYIIN